MQKGKLGSFGIERRSGWALRLTGRPAQWEWRKGCRRILGQLPRTDSCSAPIEASRTRKIACTRLRCSEQFSGITRPDETARTDRRDRRAPPLSALQQLRNVSSGVGHRRRTQAVRRKAPGHPGAHRQRHGRQRNTICGADARTPGVAIFRPRRGTALRRNLSALSGSRRLKFI